MDADDLAAPFPEEQWVNDDLAVPFPEEQWVNDYLAVPFPGEQWVNDDLAAPFPEEQWVNNDLAVPFPGEQWVNDFRESNPRCLPLISYFPRHTSQNYMIFFPLSQFLEVVHYGSPLVSLYEFMRTKPHDRPFRITDILHLKIYHLCLNFLDIEKEYLIKYDRLSKQCIHKIGFSNCYLWVDGYVFW